MSKGKNVASVINIKLLPSGFFMEISPDDGGLQLPELLDYVKKLNIPNTQVQSVKKAFTRPRGQACLIAPAPGAGAATPAPAASVRPKKVLRWLRPLFKPNTPVKPAQYILIIDTSQVMVKVFKTAFATAQIEVLFANQPQVFQSIISKKKPDLIMLAAHLGRIDGGLLAIKIRTTPKTAQVPIIMYSSPRPRHEIIRQFDSGISDYLVMPVDVKTYQAKIVKILSQVRKTIILTDKQLNRKLDKKREAEVEEIKKVDIKLTDLIKNVTQVMAVPYILDRVLKISDDSVSGAKELSLAIQSDSATSATVLKKANTAFFGKREPISDIQEAIVRIGINEVRTLVLGMSVIKQFSKEQKSNGFNRLDFWKHSLATAILAKIFAGQVKFSSPDDVFLGGLLHDIGKMILDEYANPPFDDIVMKAISKRRPLYLIEKEMLDFTHVEVGKAIVKSWKFPDSLTVVIERHHFPEARAKEKSKPQDLLMARLVYIADIMAKALGVGCGGDMSIHELPLTPWVKSLQRLSLDDEVLNQFQKELADVGDFLEISGNVGETVSRTGELPEVFFIDPLTQARLFSVSLIHLTVMGYHVHSFERASELPKIDPGSAHAFCVHLENYDDMQGFIGKLKERMVDAAAPLVIILPEQAKHLQEKLHLPERPPFLKENQTLLYEPYDIEQLQNALEAN